MLNVHQGAHERVRGCLMLVSGEGGGASRWRRGRRGREGAPHVGVGVGRGRLALVSG